MYIESIYYTRMIQGKLGFSNGLGTVHDFQTQINYVHFRSLVSTYQWKIPIVKSMDIIKEWNNFGIKHGIHRFWVV